MSSNCNSTNLDTFLCYHLGSEGRFELMAQRHYPLAVESENKIMPLNFHAVSMGIRLNGIGPRANASRPSCAKIEESLTIEYNITGLP